MGSNQNDDRLDAAGSGGSKGQVPSEELLRSLISELKRTCIQQERTSDIIFQVQHQFSSLRQELMEGASDASPLLLENKKFPTEVRLPDKSELRLRQVIDLVPYLIMSLDASGRFTLGNRAAELFYGLPPGGLIGQSLDEVIRSPDRLRVHEKENARILGGGLPQRAREEGLFNARGERVFLQTSKVPMVDPTSGETSVLVISVDITEQKRAERALKRRAFYDQLTGLPSRDLFRERLRHAIEAGGRHGIPGFAVLFTDLDGFKEVNDTYGHQVGDVLLVEVAERLKHCVRPGDTVARFGGDEFAILLQAVENYRDAFAVSDRIHQSLAEPIVVQERALHCSTSIGVAFYDKEAPSIDEVLRDADVAMYHAKRLGPGRTQNYDAKMHAEVQSLVETKQDLREGLGRGEFELFFHPVIRVSDGHMVGVEALLRWRHPVRGLLTPGEFLQSAEHSKLLIALETWVVEAALETLLRWQRAGFFDGLKERPFLSVNVSDPFLREGCLLQLLKGPGANQIVLELTETSLVENPVSTGQIIAELRELGVKVALDDFGVGYSSLSHLHQFELDYIKIDRTFIHTLPKKGPQASIVKAIVNLAGELGLGVVAEGVEREAQKAALRDMNCLYAQGYLYAEPMAESEFLAYMKTHYEGRDAESL